MRFMQEDEDIKIKISSFSPVMIQMKTTSMDIEIERSSAEVKRPQ